MGRGSRRKRHADRLYDRCGKPLEAQHRGEYVAISSEGKTILGASVRDVLVRAKEEFGPGNFIFKVGEDRCQRFACVVVALCDEPLIGRGVSDRFTVILNHGQRLVVEP